MIVPLLPGGVGERRAHWQPEIDFVGKFKPRWHDSQNDVSLSIQIERFIDNCRITAKPILPKRVAEHGHRRGARLVFVLVKNPPDFRWRAKGGKHLRRHQHPR